MRRVSTLCIHNKNGCIVYLVLQQCMLHVDPVRLSTWRVYRQKDGHHTGHVPECLSVTGCAEQPHGIAHSVRLA